MKKMTSAIVIKLKPSHVKMATAAATTTTTMEAQTSVSKTMFYDKLKLYYELKPGKKPYTYEEQKRVIEEIQAAKAKSNSKTRREYYLLSTYDVLLLTDHRYLIQKKSKEDKDNSNIKYIVAYEDLYEILWDYHVNKTGHGGNLKMRAALKNKYNIPRPAIEKFLATCVPCNLKQPASRKIVVEPITSKNFNERGQVDLIDFQSLPDGKYKWILNYQDHCTKFVSLRALESKSSTEVAPHLLHIFLTFGAPKILQSDNGREFVNQVLSELRALWPECVIVNGRPRHTQSQGNIECSNQDVEKMLRTWMTNNNSKNWSNGIQFVQWQKNSLHHQIIGQSPYKALFGSNPRIGLTSSSIPSAILEKLVTEEDLELLEMDNVDISSELPMLEPSTSGLPMLELPMLEPSTSGLPMLELPMLEPSTSESPTSELSTSGQLTPQANVCCIYGEEAHSDYLCSKCNKIVHERYATVIKDDNNGQYLCNLCSQENNIQSEKMKASAGQSEKMKASAGQKRAAEQMLASSNAKMAKFCRFECVLLSVPKIDREPADPANIICVIVDQQNNLNQVGTEHGIIKGWFGADSLKKASATFLTIDQVQKDKLMTLREAVSIVSVGQEFVKCICKASKLQCRTKRCACLKLNVRCNSRCHSSNPCVNK